MPDLGSNRGSTLPGVIFQLPGDHPGAVLLVELFPSQLPAGNPGIGVGAFETLGCHVMDGGVGMRVSSAAVRMMASLPMPPPSPDWDPAPAVASTDKCACHGTNRIRCASKHDGPDDSFPGVLPRGAHCPQSACDSLCAFHLEGIAERPADVAAQGKAGALLRPLLKPIDDQLNF
eukprot:CAMPEP_0117696410 /NCGR_PEP_ID=MMETSP0804-20121206/28664_1 /TAXON_ID=1074897 /ORGANISM="Tetraselmis astigmatica, Strain CCMP880" /LENGTH=174 /DNA_ID=CAMNT_0005510559 /DNA_START=213 /DNA_END=737 /DNA_ORIENTATION=+